MSAFILEVIAKHGDPAPRLCNKDPFTMKSAVYLGKLFPNSKFILMVRDGRAVVHSVISRKVSNFALLTATTLVPAQYLTNVKCFHDVCSLRIFVAYFFLGDNFRF